MHLVDELIIVQRTPIVGVIGTENGQNLAVGEGESKVEHSVFEFIRINISTPVPIKVLESLPESKGTARGALFDLGSNRFFQFRGAWKKGWRVLERFGER